jgi:DNA-binding transcriptional regulator YhcF (GntR family)
MDDKHLIHFQNVALVAISDQALQDEEMEYLTFLGERMGISHESMVKAVENLENADFITPESEMERKEQLQDAIVIIASKNSEINPVEYATCLGFAKQLGFTQAQLDDMVKDFIQSITE